MKHYLWVCTVKQIGMFIQVKSKRPKRIKTFITMATSRNLHACLEHTRKPFNYYRSLQKIIYSLRGLHRVGPDMQKCIYDNILDGQYGTNLDGQEKLFNNISNIDISLDKIAIILSWNTTNKTCEIMPDNTRKLNILPFGANIKM